ncbi:MAG: DUF975 family protein [Candidatus Schekmanbacteria bacterium]|nr:MAG: DUF975 family protein [Candidatus Schekmanbacteria bacterium]
MSQWHYILKGEKFGPVDEETLKQKIESGEISADTHILKKGWSFWTPAHQTEIYKKTLGIVDKPAQKNLGKGIEGAVMSPAGELSIKEAFAFGWNTTKSNLGFLIPAYLIIFIAPLIPGFLGMFAGNNAFVGIIVFLLSFILSLLMQMGSLKIVLKFTYGEKPVYDDLINTYPLIVKYLLALIVVCIIVGAGMVLLIIPGIILMLALQFFAFVIVDKEVGAIEAVKKSYAITKGHWLNIFLFNLLFSFVSFIGFLVIGIGALVSIPVAMLAYAHFYRQLAGEEIPSEPIEVPETTEEEPKPSTLTEKGMEEPSLDTSSEPEETKKPEPAQGEKETEELKIEEDDLANLSLDDISVESETELEVLEEEKEVEAQPETVETEQKEEEPEPPPPPKKPLKFQFSDSKKKEEEKSESESE